MSETSAPPVSIVEFLKARLDEAERFATMARLNAATRARLLREVESKRAILDHAVYQEKYTCTDCVDDGSVILSALASVYADHADYDERWRS